jgi:predicted ATPase
MAILEGIRIQNYRALKDVTLGKVDDNETPALTRLVAIIGANGTGKSTLIDALEFLQDCLREGVQAACDKPQRGGFERLRTQGSDGPICIEVQYREDDQALTLTYILNINLNQQGQVYVVSEELHGWPTLSRMQPISTFLSIRNGEGFVCRDISSKGTQNAIELNIDKPVLGISIFGVQANYPFIATFCDFLSEWYLCYFEPKQAKVQPLSGADPHLDQTGENLAKYLQFVERENPTGFSEMLQRIARKIPGIQGIKPIKAPDRRLLLEFTVEGFDNPLYQQDMSDGTLKMLAYLLLMEDPNPAPLIGIEEPENGLYPQLLGKLAAEFSAYAEQPNGPQILITTHSQNFIDALSPEEVWILDKGVDGFSRLLRTADIRGVPELFEAGLPMGSLWYSNHFGTDKP